MQNPSQPCYRQDPTTGVFVPDVAVSHRDHQYDPAFFQILLDMQENHFWYHGRHRFLLRALQRELGRYDVQTSDRRAVDLGGGCGGWLQYLQRYGQEAFSELALADSSLDCLRMAQTVVGGHVRRYHADLANLRWTEQWDVAFLLDVLEHLPDHIHVMRQIARSLRPGGILLITTPALQFFWSSNDELVHHVRRYAKRDFHTLAQESGLTLSCSRYFMFFLSPLLLMRRLHRTRPATLTDDEARQRFEREHRVPPAWINRLLGAVFACETPLGLWLPFPWGTSLLGVFRKPRGGR